MSEKHSHVQKKRSGGRGVGGWKLIEHVVMLSCVLKNDGVEMEALFYWWRGEYIGLRQNIGSKALGSPENQIACRKRRGGGGSEDVLIMSCMQEWGCTRRRFFIGDRATRRQFAGCREAKRWDA